MTSRAYDRAYGAPPLHEPIDDEQPFWQTRSALATVRGIPWWAAVLLAVAFTGIGVFADLERINRLGVIFQACYFVGCVVAVLWVQRRGLFGPAVQPPLILAVAVPGVVLATSGASTGDGLTAKALAVGTPLINGFPTMAITTGVTLLIGLVRLARERSPKDALQPAGRRGPRQPAGRAPGGRDQGDRQPAGRMSGGRNLGDRQPAGRHPTGPQVGPRAGRRGAEPPVPGRGSEPPPAGRAPDAGRQRGPEPPPVVRRRVVEPPPPRGAEPPSRRRAPEPRSPDPRGAEPREPGGAEPMPRRPVPPAAEPGAPAHPRRPPPGRQPGQQPPVQPRGRQPHRDRSPEPPPPPRRQPPPPGNRPGPDRRHPAP